MGLKISNLAYIGIDYSINKFSICLISDDDKPLLIWNARKSDYSKFKKDYSEINLWEINKFDYHGEVLLSKLKRNIPLKYESKTKCNKTKDFHFFEKAEIMSDLVLEFIDRIKGEFLTETTPLKISIEGYSRGSFGRSDDTREFTGILKSKLCRKGLHYDLIAPNSLKLFYSGFGGGSKSDYYLMEEATRKRLGYIFENDDINDSFGLALTGKYKTDSKTKSKKNNKTKSDGKFMSGNNLKIKKVGS